MRILIVAPKFVRVLGHHYHFPLGLGYISSALKRAGFDVHCLNCNLAEGSSGEQVFEAVQRLRPDIMATGGLSPFLSEIQSCFAASRQAKPDIRNIVGGGVLSSDPEVCMLTMDTDFGVIGEGELTIVELIRAIESNSDLSCVAGIIYRKSPGSTELARTLERRVIADLGTVAWPDYEGFGGRVLVNNHISLNNYFYHTEAQPRCIDMVTSRSCPFSCTFCFHPSGKIYRERPLDDFFTELDHVAGTYGVNMVCIVDELFSLRKARLIEFCQRIKPYKLSWMVQLHVNSADESIIELMKDSGCTYVSYGIESMSQPVLESMQKKSKVERIDTTLERTYRHKIGIQGNLIFGDTAETLDTANETMTWWASHRQYQVYINTLMVFPGSPDYIEAVRDGIITDRDQYVRENKCFLNISKINNENLQVLCWLVSAWTRTLIVPVNNPVMAFTGRRHATRGPLFNLSWDCPRCSTHNLYEDSPLDDDDHQNFIRMTCRACLSRFDMPNYLNKPNVTSEQDRHMKALFDKGEYLCLQRDFAAATRVAREMEAIVPKSHRIDLLIGRILIENNNQVTQGIDRFFNAAVQNLHCPEPHIRLGMLFERLGLAGAARMHFQHALILDNNNQLAKGALAAMLPPVGVQKFFPSVSAAPAPQRAAIISAPKKRIPDFSDLPADIARSFRPPYSNSPAPSLTIHNALGTEAISFH